MGRISTETNRVNKYDVAGLNISPGGAGEDKKGAKRAKQNNAKSKLKYLFLLMLMGCQTEKRSCYMCETITHYGLQNKYDYNTVCNITRSEARNIELTGNYEANTKGLRIRVYTKCKEQ